MFLKKIISSTLLLASLAFFIFVPAAQAETYYVDTDNLGGTCNDAGSGTSPSSAWCTLTKAATTAVGGDTVNVRGGTYRETATFSNSGSSGSPIIFQKYQNETPIINGADVPGTWISLGNSEAGGLFNNGFESGDFSDFNSTTIDASNTTTVQGLFTNNGLYSMKTVYGGTAANSKASKTITPANDVYARIYFQMAAGFDLAATGSRFDILYIKEDSTTNLARASIVKNGSNSFSVQGRIEAPAGSSYAAQTFYSGSAGEISTGTWHYIELRYNGQDAATGGAQLWLDGVSKGSVLSLDTTGANNTPGRIEIGGNSSAATVPTSGSTLYIDDFKTDTSAVGAFSAAGNANIYQATGINWTVRQVFEDGELLTPQDSLAAVTAAGTWYNDTAEDILYVWSSDSTSPATHTTEASRRNMGVDLSSRSYIRLDGLTLKYHNNTSYGSVHLLGSSNNTLTNLIIMDNLGSGVFLNSSTSNSISNSQLLRNKRLFGGGIRFENGSHTNTVSNNTITGNGLDGGNGISLCGDSTCNSTGNNSNTFVSNTISNVYDTCMYFDTNNDDNTVERNRCSESYRTSTSSGGNGFHFALGSDSNIIRNNIVYNVQRHGISLRDGNISQGFVNNNDNVIYNNTLYNIGYGGAGLGESGNGINLQGSNSNNIIKNNIVSKVEDAAINIDPGSVGSTVSDYNLFYNRSGSGVIADYNDVTYTSLSAYQEASNQDRHSYSIDPSFANVAEANFQLASNSPAINAGTTLSSFTTDIAGNTRPYKEFYDMGAYEYLFINHPTGSSSSSSDNIPREYVCREPAPRSAPELFQIDRFGSSATLYISPAQNPYTKYHVFYGTDGRTDQHSATFDYRDATGVISYSIHALDPKAIYSFKVQAANGCMAGPWSNTLDARMTRVKAQSFYLYTKVPTNSRSTPANL